MGAGLLIGLPFLWARQPGSDASVQQRKIYALQFGMYTLAIFIVAIAVIILALVILRRTARELKDQAKLNMEVFVETSLRGHERDRTSSSSPDEPKKPSS